MSGPASFAGGASSSRGGLRKRPAKQEVQEYSDSEGSEEREGSEVDMDLTLTARVWDDLVDMEKFWTHAAVAVAELLAGTLVLVCLASCLGAPTWRCVFSMSWPYLQQAEVVLSRALGEIPC